MYNAIITKIGEVYKHPNADRLQLTKCWGSQVVISTDVKPGDWGIFFPSDGQLSEEFCHQNNLYRNGLLNKDPNKTGFFEQTRRVRAQRFLKEQSDGIWLPLESLEYTGAKLEDLKDHGKMLTTLNGCLLAQKYIVVTPEKKGAGGARNKNSAPAKSSTIMFKQHYDTPQLVYYLGKVPYHVPVVITEKLHGTSQRTGYVKIQTQYKNPIKNWLSRWGLFERERWNYVMGTRRVDHIPQLKDSIKNYHDPTMREIHHKKFVGKLHKGETVYYEVVGYEPSGKPIMGSADYGKLGKEFKKQYGSNVAFSYGNEIKESDVYIYRMTMTNEDGYTVEYPWELVQQRARDMELKTVPVVLEGMSLNKIKEQFGEKLEDVFEEWSKGASVLDPRHLKEGIVIRIGDQAYKYKSFEFKVLEGIIKDAGEPDAEEQA